MFFVHQIGSGVIIRQKDKTIINQ